MVLNRLTKWMFCAFVFNISYLNGADSCPKPAITKEDDAEDSDLDHPILDLIAGLKLAEYHSMEGRAADFETPAKKEMPDFTMRDYARMTFAQRSLFEDSLKDSRDNTTLCSHSMRLVAALNCMKSNAGKVGAHWLKEPIEHRVIIMVRSGEKSICFGS